MKIGDEKLQYDINREKAKISPLSSGKSHVLSHVYADLYINRLYIIS